MGTTRTSKRLKGILTKAVSHLLIFSMLFSCISYTPLNWVPIEEDGSDQNKKIKENFSEVYRKDIYRIIDKEGIHYMLYLKDYDEKNLYGYEYYEEDGKPKPVGGDLIEIPIHSIQEIEVRQDGAKSTLISIGVGAVLIVLSVVLGVDLLGTDSDD